jgi:hypothetical protein
MLLCTQNPPTFGSWGFDSPSRHHDVPSVFVKSLQLAWLFTLWGWVRAENPQCSKTVVEKICSRFGTHLSDFLTPFFSTLSKRFRGSLVDGFCCGAPLSCVLDTHVLKFANRVTAVFVDGLRVFL